MGCAGSTREVCPCARSISAAGEENRATPCSTASCAGDLGRFQAQPRGFGNGYLRAGHDQQQRILARSTRR